MSDSSFPNFPTDYASILARMDQVDPLLYGRTRNFLNGAVTFFRLTFRAELLA